MTDPKPAPGQSRPDPTGPEAPADAADPTPAAGVLATLVARSTQIVTIVEPDGRHRWSSAAAVRILGYRDPADVGATLLTDLLHPEDVEAVTGAVDAIRSGERSFDEPLTLRVRDVEGKFHHLEVRGDDLRDHPDIRAIVLTAHDVTHRHESQRRVARLIEVLEGSNEIVVLLDPDVRPIYANRTARELFGLTAGDDPIQDLRGRLDDDSYRRLQDDVRPLITATGVWRGELTFLTSAGIPIPAAATIQVHPGPGGGPAFVSAIAHDISDLKTLQRQLEHQATHDSLTGLPNRQLFQELGEQALARAARDDTIVGVLFLDLDHFKRINDTTGHAAGDEVLVQLANRLRKSVRAGDLVARFGGDEFIVLCEHPGHSGEMMQLADRLIAALEQPIESAGLGWHVGASVGIALGTGGRATIGDLLRDADSALYEAKARGRGRAVYFGENGTSAGDARFGGPDSDL